MIHITKYLVSIKLHFVCFLIGFLLFMNIFYLPVGGINLS